MIKFILSKIQNFLYFYLSKLKTKNKNKILFICSYAQLGSVMKELKKDKKNIIIRGFTSVGLSLFKKDVDYFITFKNSDNFIKKIIKDVNVVVSTHDVLPFENKIFKIANELKIPSLVVQHGINESDTFIPKISTKMAVWGEITKKWRMKNGENEKKLVITGAPQFDQYYYIKKSKEDVLKDISFLKTPKKIILYTPHPFVINPTGETGTGYKYEDILNLDDQKKLLEILFYVTKRLNLFLIIKLHPSNDLNLKEIESLFSNLNYKDYFIFEHKTGLLTDLILISDIVISHSSTTLIEGMILKKPVITIGFENKEGALIYSKKGGAFNVHNEKELEEKIRLILNNKILRDKIILKNDFFVEKYCYKIDGKSSFRVAKLITDLVDYYK